MGTFVVANEQLSARPETPWRRRARAVLAVFAAIALVAGCGSDGSGEAQPSSVATTVAPPDPSVAETTPTTEAATTAAQPSPTTTTTAVATTGPPNSQPTTTDRPPTTEQATTTESPPTTTTPEPRQPAIWPAADVVLATPEEAAASFVSEVLGVPPTLGEFQPGDNRSGEIEVFSPGEGSEPRRTFRSRLLLRQLGPDDGWFVLAAVSEQVTITAPAASSSVPPGPIIVGGVGRGFEALLVIETRLAGAGGPPLIQQITMAGGMGTSEPYAVIVDLSPVDVGETVMLIVRGGTGLETDPGEFSAVPVVIG